MPPKANGCMFTLPTRSRCPIKLHILHFQLRPFGRCLLSQSGHRLEVPLSVPVKHSIATRLHLCRRYEISLPYSHPLMRWFCFFPQFFFLTPCGLPT